uniref:Dynein regulatory complex protein 1 n=1 Tax=Periophthalmus magnuspinnatus TaxID=409849 RepID=A0A3B4B4D2_9GOBI
MWLYSEKRTLEAQREHRERGQGLIKLKRDLNTMVTNIQAAAEAREVQWRTDIDKAYKIRLELLEDHNLSSKGKIEEISKGWDITKERMIPQEVHAALIYQQQQCDELIKDKKKIMDVIQQDLKARDDSFVADLKKQTEELQLMLERMEEQDKTLTKAYREELEQWKKVRALTLNNVDKLLKRQQAVEEYETQIHHLMFEASDNFNMIRNREFADFQVHYIYKKSELAKLRVEKQTVKGRKEKQLMEKQLKELNRKSQDYERIQKKIIQLAIVDAIKFENMWLTVDAEVKELLERALYVDSMIYENVLHIPWEQPNLSFAEPGRRWEGRYAVSQTSQCHQVNGILEGVYNDSESEAEGFLFEVKIVKLLNTLDENEQTLIKMGYLFNVSITLGIKEEDVPKLADFLFKYAQHNCNAIDHFNLIGTKNTDKWSVQSLEARDMSKEEAYWESLGNAITADKLKIWEVTEKKLHTVLSEISKFSQEIQSLQQENTELHMVCMLLQQVCLDQPLFRSPHVSASRILTSQLILFSISNQISLKLSLNLIFVLVL